MSNLANNTTTINNINDTVLTTLIEKVNSLPTAGGGGGTGGVEAWTGTVHGLATITLGGGSARTICYVAENFTCQQTLVSANSEVSITVAAGTFIITIDDSGSGDMTSFSAGSNVTFTTINTRLNLAIPTANNFELYC